MKSVRTVTVKIMNKRNFQAFKVSASPVEVTHQVTQQASGQEGAKPVFFAFKG